MPYLRLITIGGLVAAALLRPDLVVALWSLVTSIYDRYIRVFTSGIVRAGGTGGGGAGQGQGG